MSIPQPTLGPWRYAKGVVTSPEGRVVAYLSHDAAPNLAAKAEEAEANGQAIAALPSLIATLKEIALMRGAGSLSTGEQVFAVTSARHALRAAGVNCG